MRLVGISVGQGPVVTAPEVREIGEAAAERHGLRLSLLGPPRARLNGNPLQLRTKKAFALLAYLATETRTHRRAELAAMLWPDSDEKKARTTLRSVIADLRSALDAGDGPRADYLIVDRDTLIQSLCTMDINHSLF